MLLLELVTKLILLTYESYSVIDVDLDIFFLQINLTYCGGVTAQVILFFWQQLRSLWGKPCLVFLAA